MSRGQLGAELAVGLAQRGHHALEGEPEGVGLATGPHLHRKVSGGDGVRHPHVVAEEVEEPVEGPAHLSDLVAALVVGELDAQIAPRRRGGELRRVAERPHQVARDHVGGDGAADGHERDQHQGAADREPGGGGDLGHGCRLQLVGCSLDAVDQLDLLGADGEVLLQVLRPGLATRALRGQSHDAFLEPIEDVHVHPLGGVDALAELGRSEGLHLRHVLGEIAVRLQLAGMLLGIERVQHVAAHAVAHLRKPATNAGGDIAQWEVPGTVAATRRATYERATAIRGHLRRRLAPRGGHLCRRSKLC